MDSKNKNASEKADEVVDKQKQTNQQPPKVNVRVNLPFQPTQQSKFTSTPNRNVVINQSGHQFSIPLSTLQSMQPGQGTPTGQPGHLLVKKETGKMKIASLLFAGLIAFLFRSISNPQSSATWRFRGHWEP